MKVIRELKPKPKPKPPERVPPQPPVEPEEEGGRLAGEAEEAGRMKDEGRVDPVPETPKDERG